MEQAIEVSPLSTLMTSSRTGANSVPKGARLDFFPFTSGSQCWRLRVKSCNCTSERTFYRWGSSDSIHLQKSRKKQSEETCSVHATASNIVPLVGITLGQRLQWPGAPRSYAFLPTGECSATRAIPLSALGGSGNEPTSSLQSVLTHILITICTSYIRYCLYQASLLISCVLTLLKQVFQEQLHYTMPQL